MADAETDPMSEWPTGRLLSTAARLVEHAWVESLEQLGVTHAGLIALHILGRTELSQTELATRARVEVQTMSRTLDRLEREGFITRGKDPLDARRHVVTRTDAGERVWASARSIEADLYPSVADTPEMRGALLAIIEASSARRWGASGD